MTAVKWVCSECGTNNIGYTGGLLQCSVCGRVRVDEAVDMIDEGIVNLDGLSRWDIPSLSIRNTDQLLMIATRHINKLLLVILAATMALALGYLAVLGIEGDIEAAVVFGNLGGNITALLGGHRFSAPFVAYYQFISARISVLPDVLHHCTVNCEPLLAWERLETPTAAVWRRISERQSDAEQFWDNMALLLSHISEVILSATAKIRVLLYSLTTRIAALIQEI